MSDIEDIIHEALMGERRRPERDFSLAPVLACFHEAVRTARRQERQAILDAWLAARRQRTGKQWGEAFMALVRILAERAENDSPQAAE
jgi:hypothetical protein